MLNYECRNATLGFAPFSIQHSKLKIQYGNNKRNL